ncbi:hypothetical protein AB1N83_012438 [Pleurotus pulmonarius]
MAKDSNKSKKRASTASTSSASLNGDPNTDKVTIYTSDTLNRGLLIERTEEILGKKPFDWQIDAAAAVLCGEDVVLDVGTGCGKSLCFSIPLVLNNTDVALRITPLTALMIDQAESSKLQSIALCSETMAVHGAKTLYKHICSKKCREVYVSPELAISPGFRKHVLSKKKFYQRLRLVAIDEAHCISLWGGTFRPDYESLGLLRGRFPKHVPFMIASATLPDHVLDDIRGKLQLSKSVRMVRVSNARPNIALSCRATKHAEESKADLRFLIPPDAAKPEDIPISLVYCNQRVKCEDAVDRLRQWAQDAEISDKCIAFYHAKVGSKQKRELERQLAKGLIRILVCTDAVGMVSSGLVQLLPANGPQHPGM